MYPIIYFLFIIYYLFLNIILWIYFSNT